MSTYYGKGAILSDFDSRDYRVAAARSVKIPDNYELSTLPVVKNQRSVGSCVAHAMSSIMDYFYKTEYTKARVSSTDFIYGMQGVMFNRLQSGMYLRDACKIAQQYGNVPRTMCNTNTEMPYAVDVAKAVLEDENSKSWFNAFKVLSYARCTTEKDIKAAILSGSPILASVKWYDKYDLDDNALVSDFSSDYGYHAIYIYGWSERGYLCQNSWGTGFGNKGRFILPYNHKVQEAWSFVDILDPELDIVTPANNWFTRLLNSIVNFFLKLIRK